MKTCLIIILLFVSNWCFTQTIEGFITGVDKKPVPFAEVIDTISQNKTLSDQAGFFELAVGDSFALVISHPSYVTETFKLERSGLQERAHYIMKERIQLIEGVTVSSERMETLVDQRNTNVIDYLPFDDVLLVLKSHKDKRFLSIEGQDTTFRTFEIGKIKPNELYTDCFNNIHLLSEDSSYQLLLDTVVTIIDRASIKEFNYLVKPCVADFEHSQVFGNFTKHNKLYTLTRIHNETNTREHFLHIYDREAERVARSCYYEIIGRYFAVTPKRQNVIINGIWTGDIMDLPGLDNTLDQMIVWYLKVRATELNVQSVQFNNQVINIDQYSDSIRIYDEYNELMYSEQHEFHKSKRVHEVLLDHSSGALFEQYLEKGVYSLREIPLEPARAPRNIKIKEAPFCKNIKVHDDWVYFMTKENDYYQINRIYLGKKNPIDKGKSTNKS